MFNKILVATAVSLFSVVAAAAIHVEPGLTYETGKSDYTWPAPLSNSSGDLKGPGFNLKIGASLNDILFLVADGSYSRPKFTNSANNYDATATSTLLGVTLGAQMPIVGLRIWGGYILDGTLNPEASGGTDVQFTGAHGMKLGAGFKILLVSLNLEYADIEYKDTSIQAGTFTGSPSGGLKNKMTIVSVSFPLAM